MAGHHCTQLSKGNVPVKIRGVFDLKEERLQAARDKGFIAYPSREALLSDPDIDIALVATTNDSHAEIVKDALRHGKHVLCEKPAAMSSEELIDMMAVAKECGKVFTIDQNRRVNKDFVLMRRSVEAGLIGKPYVIESRVEGSRGMPEGWRCIKELGGGMMLDWGVHLIDQILYMSDARVTCVYCKMYSINYTDVEDNFRLTLTMSDGLTAHIEVSTNNFIMHPRWYICGERGTLQIDDWSCGGRIVRCAEGGDSCTEEIIYTQAGPKKTMLPRRPEETETLEFSADDSIVDNFTAVYDQFIDAVEGKAELTIAPEQTMRVMKVIDAAFESAEKDSVIHLVI